VRTSVEVPANPLEIQRAHRRGVPQSSALRGECSHRRRAVRLPPQVRRRQWL